MEKLILNIKGFKCFTNGVFELNNMTLLTGANASGKSSVVQALLLLKAASESDDSLAMVGLSDSRYAFDFGNPDSLINNEWKEDEISIILSENCSIGFEGAQQAQDGFLRVSIANRENLKRV